MLVPLPWLREHCDPALDVGAIEERLTMTGTKVESIHHRGVPQTGNFVVGKVLSAEQHPNADRLKLCRVDLGAEEPATIVCGAPNVAAGQTVAVARPGAVMPDGRELGAAELRGVVSEGMILSAEELELAPGRDGIVVLDDPLGLPINGVENWQAGFLPPIFQGTRFRSKGSPVLDLRPETERPVGVVFRPGIFGHPGVGRAADIYGVGGVGLDECADEIPRPAAVHPRHSQGARQI